MASCFSYFGRMDVISFLRDNVFSLYRDAIALSYSDGELVRLSYAQLGELVARGADTEELSQCSGKLFGIYGNNTPQWLLQCLSIICSGNIAVPMDSENPDKELLKRCAAIYYDSKVRIRPGLTNTYRQRKTVDYVKAWSRIITEVLQGPITGQTVKCVAPCDPSSTALIATTSGTTGPRKYVEITHENIVSALLFSRRVFNNTLGPSDSTCPIMPTHHVYSLICGLLDPLVFGMELRYGALSESSVIKRVGETEPTTIIGVSATANALLKYMASNEGSSDCALPSVRTIVAGGSPLQDKVDKKAQKLGIGIYCGYGLTECASVACCNSRQHKRIGSVGKIIDTPYCSIEVNEDSRVVIHGTIVAKGYLGGRRFNNTFVTNDIGYINCGYLYLAGRVDGMISTENGTKVLPELVEKRLCSYPEIEDAYVYQTLDSKTNRYVLAAKIVLSSDTVVEAQTRHLVSLVNARLPADERIVRFDVVAPSDLPSGLLGKRIRAVPHPLSGA